MRAMRSPMSPVKAWYARLCLSLTIHVEYSFWRTRLPATGLTLPWQLVAAQEPGPMYFTGSPFESAFDAAFESFVESPDLDAPSSVADNRRATAGSSKSAAHSATCSQ